MKITMIVAYAANRVIGNKNELPWPRLKPDMKRFKQLTTGHTIVMGRKTWESIDRKVLPGRLNVVMTRDFDWTPWESPDSFKDFDDTLGPFIAMTPEHAMEIAERHAINSDQPEYNEQFPGRLGEPQLFVIGGAEIYKLFIPFADEILATEIKLEYEGDTKFPELSKELWREVSRTDEHEDFSYVRYEKIWLV